MMPKSASKPAAGSAAEALQGLLRHLAATLDTHLADMGQRDSPDDVHKARVTLRRMRVALIGFKAILGSDAADDLDDKLRTRFRQLGRIRDADIVGSQFAGTGQAQAFVKDAEKSRANLRKILQNKKVPTFATLIDKSFVRKGWHQSGKAAKALRHGPASALATTALDKAWAECVENGTNLALLGPRAQHQLRKDLKTLRYLGEIFAPQDGTETFEDFQRIVVRLQDDLGALNDRATAESHGLAVAETAESRKLRQDASLALADLVAAGKWWQDGPKQTGG